MSRKRRLQVFVSSTYDDLKAERQAAVEAILCSGHIPAGMELFTAGDESQMSVIRRWIDDSDVFLLILGGRYGSIEPSSGKSYIHLEYEYALARHKPFFAVVITDDHLDSKVRQEGRAVLENEYPQKLLEFRKMLHLAMIRPWSDPRDIKLAILETMAEFSHRSELIGWIPGDEAVDGVALAQEIARLTKENSELRVRLSEADKATPDYNGLSFAEACKVLSDRIDITYAGFPPLVRSNLTEIARLFGDPEPALLHGVWLYSDFLGGKGFTFEDPLINRLVFEPLRKMGFVEVKQPSSSRTSFLERSKYVFSSEGTRFYLRLKLERGTDEANLLVFEPEEGRKNAPAPEGSKNASEGRTSPGPSRE